MNLPELVEVRFWTFLASCNLSSWRMQKNFSGRFHTSLMPTPVAVLTTLYNIPWKMCCLQAWDRNTETSSLLVQVSLMKQIEK